MRAPALLLLAAAAALLACTGAVDTADRVHDLRMLGMRAEPPEVVLPVAFLPDGGIVSRGPLPPLPPITITGLIADPNGGGREVTTRFSTCSARDSDTARCAEDSPGYRVLAEGSVTPTALGAEPAVTFTPTWQDISGAVVEDPYHGFGGLPLAVQLEVNAGDESVVGIKRVVFTAALGAATVQPANTNPALDGVTYAGVDWAEGQVVDFNGSVRRGFRGSTVTADNPIEVLPTASLVESYDRTAFDGSTVHFTETWRYAFFATAGSFSPSTVGGNAGPPGTGPQPGDPANTKWVPDLGESGGPVTVWIVVRDGRGGETWTVRQATAPSLPGGP